MDDQTLTNPPTDQEAAAEATNNQTQTGASDFLNLDSQIKSYVSRLENLKQELKTQKDMLDSSLLNDEVYQNHDKAAKEAAKVRAGTKQQIMKQPNISQVSEKVNGLKDEYKELQESLSEALRQYQKISGATQIELSNGEVMEIVNSVRLVKKSAEFRP